MMVIGLTGLATVGKSAVADILVRDYGFEKRSFAGPLKEMLRTLDPYLNEDWGEDDPNPRLSEILDYMTEDQIKGSVYGDEYRRLLQVLGTDCIRSIDGDFWINAARKTLTDPDGKYVFDDCRFTNEAQMIYDMNGRLALESETFDGWYTHINVSDVWHVTRPGVELAPDAHESEQHAGHMGETVEIMNGGTLELLKETVDVAMNFFAAARHGWKE